MNENIKIALFILFLISTFYFFSVVQSDFGEIDFRIYWAAANTFWQGENVYDLNVLSKFLGSDLENGVWNPPWFYVALLPVTFLSLNQASALLVCLNFFFLYLIIKLLPIIFDYDQTESDKRNSRFNADSISELTTWIFTLLASPSILFCLKYGQWGIILTYCLLRSYIAIQQKKYGLSLLLLVPLTIKPHFGFAIAALILLKAINLPSLVSILRVAAFASLLCLLAIIINPVAADTWFGGNVYPSAWQGSTLVSEIQEQLINYHQAKYIKYLPVIAIILGLLTTFKIYISKLKASTKLVLASLISLVFAPYGFIFDQVIAIIPLYTISQLAYNTFRERISASLLLIIVGVVSWLPIFFTNAREWFAYYPVILFIIYLAIAKVCKEST